MRRQLTFLAAAVVAIPAPARAGQATCSNPGPPAGAAASSELVPGRLTAVLTTSVLPTHGEEQVFDLQGPLQYEADVLVAETRLAAEYALRSWLAIGAALPYRRIGVGVTYRDHLGDPIEPTEMIHARDEVVHGIGDGSLLVHGARELGGLRWHARLGTSVPLGGTEPDPFELGRFGMEHQHIQLGTGTFIPFVAIEAQRELGRDVIGSIWGLTHLSLYENRHGFQAGHRFSGGITALSRLGTRRFGFAGAAELHAETGERWDGVVPTDEGNQGRADLLVGLAVSWRPTPDLGVVVDVKAPVWSHVVGNQLDYGVVVGVGLTGSFDLAPRASYAGADHEDLGPPGSAAALEPVAGKITVFDLWADWCAPCRELDDALARLAREHPDRLAVRRLEVVDDESAAWAAYLEPGEFALPHVKVYDARGALILERTAPVDVLIEELEALLSR